MTNSDDILFIKKTKEENTASIKSLEAKIDTIDREIEQRTANLKAQLESVKDPKNDAKEKENRDITCKHYNNGFCKMKQRCLFMHRSKQILIQNVKIQNVKKDILKDVDISCWRRDTYSYLHEYNLEKAGNDNEHIDETVNAMEVDDSTSTHVKEINAECGNCKSEKVKNY